MIAVSYEIRLVKRFSGMCIDTNVSQVRLGLGRQYSGWSIDPFKLTRHHDTSHFQAGRWRLEFVLNPERINSFVTSQF